MGRKYTNHSRYNFFKFYRYEPLPLADNNESSDDEDPEPTVDSNIQLKTFEIDQGNCCL